jgi:hypothetical protein
MAAEIWKDIPGYEGKYQASTEGRIRSLDRNIDCYSALTRTKYTRFYKGRVLQPGGNNKDGHYSVVLKHGAASVLVHYLVLKTFVGERPPGMDIRHLNGDPKDNRLCNLRYGTRTENILDVYRVGGRWRKLTSTDVQDIRIQLTKGVRVKDIAEKYGCSVTSISRIKKGRTFKWLQES